MTISDRTNRNINDEYSNIVDAVVQHRPFHKFNFYYRLLTPDGEKKYIAPWYDYLLDSYSKYRHSGFNDIESQTNSLMDGLESLLKDEEHTYFEGRGE